MFLHVRGSSFCVFLCGDVMTGRGIDQVLPRPGNPQLHESWVADAREYVELAERVNGPIRRPVNFEYIWGDALAELEHAGTDVRIINLETSITSNDEHWPDKGIHYRMHPQNTGCLSAARIDGCSLANNHVLDWGCQGLVETLECLRDTGIAHAGAGRNAEEAAAPAELAVADRGRVLLFSFGSITSGIPPEWRATSGQPGINVLEDLSESTASRIADRMRRMKQSGDVSVASIHWGSNWGYEIPQEQITFAHRLADEGFDVIHGHSSHHVKTVEVYGDRLILYGCGDFVTDYEGITAHESFRGSLALMYFAYVDPLSGRLISARLVPMRMRQFQLRRASPADAIWLCDLLNELGSRFRTRVELAKDNSMSVVW